MTKSVTHMTIDDAEHFSEEQKAAIIASYPPHERSARVRGEPSMGAGMVFPVDFEELLVDPFDIPEIWTQLGGLDFGWDHPTAAVKLAHDRDSDAVYVTNVYKRRQATPLEHSTALLPWGAWLPWAWPMDGWDASGKQGSKPGLPLKDAYASHGLNMMDEHAKSEDGSTGVEGVVQTILERMQTKRFHVFRHLEQWLSEARQYHRKDGRIVREFDDLMSATRYAVMMLRHGAVDPGVRKRHSGNGQHVAGGWMG